MTLKVYLQRSSGIDVRDSNKETDLEATKRILKELEKKTIKDFLMKE